ncbi:MAG: cation:proton antiporter domain-containing protein [Acidithiobacillus ferrivorans]
MQLGYSGVISTVVAGLICGNYGAKRGMAPSVSLAVNTFWEYIGFALNSLVFLLVGLTIRLPDLLRIWPLVIAAYVAITIARGAVIYSMGALLSRSRAHAVVVEFCADLGRHSRCLIHGAGLESSTTLSLPGNVDQSRFWCGFVDHFDSGPKRIAGSPRLGVVSRRHLPLAQMGLQEIDRLRHEGVRDPQALDALTTHYSQESKDAKDRLSNFDIVDEDRFRTDFSRLYRRLLTMQKQRLLDARQESLIGYENFERLTADIDAGLLEGETNADRLIERLLLPEQERLEKKAP